MTSILCYEWQRKRQKGIVFISIELFLNMQQLKPNTTLQGGKYRIDRVLGQGGFGITYVGYNTEFEETIVIKEFFMKGVTERDETTSVVGVSNADNVQQFDEQREKFKKEARRLRRLKNEHIVKVHDLFEENGTAYYVMDYVDGESLSEKIKHMGSALPEAEVKEILTQILSALKEVHQNEIWHLDLKPGNIMIDKHGVAYLIDFGASKQLRANGSMTTSTALCYTPGYAPNEQIGQMYDRFGPWTDIYALGATVYNLLSNKKPPMAIDIEEDEEDAFDFPTSVSDEMRKLVVWMMQPKRKARPQNVEDLIEKLVNKQTGELTTAETNKPVTKLEPVGASDPINEETLLIGQFKGRINTSIKTNYNNKIQAFDVNGISFNMIRVEGGTFTMGATSEQGSDAFDDEMPPHKVKLSPYYIGESEVTQALWEAVMGGNPSIFKGANRPVESVSWNDCQSFIEKLNSMTGQNFRLPTEAEWEYAARGGKKSQRYKYSGSNTLDNVAWYFENSGGETHEVMTKSPNELGIYDMSGNVEEWCDDRYGDYSSNSQPNPISQSLSSSYVNRGGSWISNVRNCRVSYRFGSSRGSQNFNQGLRLAL